MSDGRAPPTFPCPPFALKRGSGGTGILTRCPSPSPSTGSGSTGSGVTFSGSVCQGSFTRPGVGALREFAPSYTQVREALGIAIVAGPGVASEALDAAEATILRTFLNNDLEHALADVQAYVIVAEPDQDVLDLPEFSCLEDSVTAGFFDHVCGVADICAY